MRFTRLICLDHPYQIATLEQCQLKLFRNEPSRISIVQRYNRTERLYCNITIFKKAVNYRQILPTQVYDACRFLEDKMELDPITSYIHAAIKQYAPQLFRPCPIEGLYDASDLRIPENLTVPIFPPGDYYSEWITYNEKNQIGLRVQFYSSVRQSGIFG
ncbi:uncharacterized protein LOC129770206 [Toxorhynchites rutilus septentrionalis]|uniref:uncharacterized protein LOC129770206 n=1 Tax=Toxorhynchites rutilus septentrionalis TaxID=329112 RepID=UPI002478FA57|nr:uncharacterized protein LOC129770206 [Toxorhynchites rutilus septentrionalis]